MHTPQVPTYFKVPHYRIQDPVSQLYARIEGPPPAKPEPAEDTAGAVYWRNAHVKFTRRALATSFETFDEALRAFGSHLGVSALEIVRCDA